MNLELAETNLALAETCISLIDKSNWKLEDLLRQFEEQNGNTKLVIAKLLVMHFGEELTNEVLLSICKIKEMKMNPDLLEILFGKEKLREIAFNIIFERPVEELDFRTLVELCPVDDDDIRKFALECMLKLNP